MYGTSSVPNYTQALSFRGRLAIEESAVDFHPLSRAVGPKGQITQLPNLPKIPLLTLSSVALIFNFLLFSLKFSSFFPSFLF